MKTVTKEYKLYSINELSEKSKEKAYSNWLSNFDYYNHSDNLATLNKFAEIFNLKIKDYSYGGQNSFIDFESQLDNNILDLTENRLRTWLINNHYSDLFTYKTFSKNGKKRASKLFIIEDYNPIGYYLDYEIAKPIYDFLSNPEKVDYEYLMNDCLNNWLVACNQDYEYCQSLESFIEDCNANDWYFLENGDMFL